eukprot:7383619-Prymnesium_polylepis.1
MANAPGLPGAAWRGFPLARSQAKSLERYCRSPKWRAMYRHSAWFSSFSTNSTPDCSTVNSSEQSM